jgi:hypothetical protein
LRAKLSFERKRSTFYKTQYDAGMDLDIEMFAEMDNVYQQLPMQGLGIL